MNSATKSPALVSLLTTIESLRRENHAPRLSPSEKAARVAKLVDRLSTYPAIPMAAQLAPITRNAEDR